VNLGHSAAHCRIDTWNAAGARLSDEIRLTLPALSQQLYVDALGILGAAEASGARFTTSCDQPFYAFGVVYRWSTGEAYTLLPAAAADRSSLAPPTAGPPPQAGCPAGATCFLRSGAFFTPTKTDPVRRYDWDVTQGQRFSRIEVSFEFTLHKWDKNSDAFYTLFYLAGGGKWFDSTGRGHAPALLVTRERGVLTAESTYGMTGKKIQAMRDSSADLVPGETYRVRYVYDAAGREMSVRMIDARGQVVGEASAGVVAKTTDVESPGWFRVQFSDEYIPGTDHVPLWGTWSDLVVAMFR
jgi:hypothetical protein